MGGFVDLTITFLGVGNARATSLGNASMIIEHNDAPWLLVDCGFDTLDRYQARHPNSLPPAVFITHCHFDHIGGLEQLYFLARFANEKPVIYVSHLLVSTLVNVLGNTLIAEGNENVWDVLNIVPVQHTFFHQGIKLHIYPVRHHAPTSAFSLHMPGAFFYTGDTRPIPEIINYHINNHEIIFHDCSVKGNPSHSGLDDLTREYEPGVLNRLVAYHYSCPDDAIHFAKHGVAYAQPNQTFELKKAAPHKALVSLPQRA
jgi:ribonuclease BN (tRNA processing enzyme)